MATIDPSNFSKEMYTLAEEKVPFGSFLAPLVLTLAILAALVASVRYIFDTLIRPIASQVAIRQGSAVGWVSLLVVVALCAAGGLVIWVVLVRKIGRVEGNLRLVSARGKLTEATKADEKELWKLMERVSALETHTDISGLKKLLVERMMRDQAPG